MSFRLLSSGHNPVRMFALFIQMAFNLVSFLLAWFSLAGFLLVTFVVNDVAGNPPHDTPAEGFPFGSATPIVNTVIQIIYLATVAFQFIIALGSQAKTHATSYIISFTIFAISQLYLVINLIYLTKRLVDFKKDTNGDNAYAYIDKYYMDIGPAAVLATGVSVVGVYIGAGILCLDPWHLLTSWLQYLLISVSYVNILKTFAISNIHDVWGRKSGGKITRLPEPTSTIRNLREDVEGPQRDVDSLFEAAVRRALEPYRAVKAPQQSNLVETSMKFRTYLVAIYLFSNFFVYIVVMNDQFKQLWWLGDPYWHKIWVFRIWMWGNSALLIMQLAGCVWQRVLGFVTLIFYRIRDAPFLASTPGLSRTSADITALSA